MKKYILTIIICLALGLVGGYFIPRPTAQMVGAIGDTNASPRLNQVVANPQSGTTYASFYNSDANARVVSGVYYWVNGIASSTALTLQAATTTTATGLGGNTSYVYNGTLSSTTQYQYISSSTPTASDAIRLWPAGTYLNFVASGTSSPTTTMIVGVDYKPL